MAKPTPDKMRLHKYLPRFKSAATEQAFRADFLPQDKFLAKIIISATILISIATVVPDTLSGVTSDSLNTLYLATFLYCAISSIVVLKLASATSRSRHFDLVVTVWWFSVIAATIMSAALYPPDMIIHVVFDVLLPVAIYLLIPIGLVLQFSLAALFTIANIGVLLTCKVNLTQTDLAFILIAYGTTHLLGFVVCWQTHLGRRKLFIEKKNEQTLRKELEETIDELHTLRGIMPICCHCKQIRDDAGFWHQVEKYIEQRSEIEFSHGICPECFKQHYPEEHRVIMDE